VVFPAPDGEDKITIIPSFEVGIEKLFSSLCLQ
jgi:hypothetical protein